MKTSHLILILATVAVGGGALFYFSRNPGDGRDTRNYYPSSQGFPASVPGAPRQIQVPTPSGKGGTADTILAAGAVGVAALPALSGLFRDLFGSDTEPAASEPTASFQGLLGFDAQGI